MEVKDRRRPSNADILVAITGLQKDVEHIKETTEKDMGYVRENTEKIANNNINQWKAIRSNVSDLTKMKGAGVTIAFILTLLSVIGIYIGVFCS